MGRGSAWRSTSTSLLGQDPLQQSYPTHSPRIRLDDNGIDSEYSLSEKCFKKFEYFIEHYLQFKFESAMPWSSSCEPDTQAGLCLGWRFINSIYPKLLNPASSIIFSQRTFCIKQKQSWSDPNIPWSYGHDQIIVWESLWVAQSPGWCPGTAATAGPQQSSWKY